MLNVVSLRLYSKWGSFFLVVISNHFILHAVESSSLLNFFITGNDFPCFLITSFVCIARIATFGMLMMAATGLMATCSIFIFQFFQ